MSIKDFRTLLGKDAVLDTPSDLSHYGKDWVKGSPCSPSFVILPSDAAQVKASIDLARKKGVALIPSGGRTGLAGGATALNSEVILSLERLNKILEIDVLGGSVTCQAGVVTQKLQEAVAARGFYFPVDLASKGSSQIGGNIATNAGGVHVVRYGVIRNWVMGLKVITGAGETLELNGKLVKNQTGYDLRSLFIGSEGTLGVIVEATLKLTSQPREVVRALCAVAEVDGAVRLFSKAGAQFPRLSLFEYFAENALRLALKHAQIKPPFPEAYPHYALLEVEVDGPAARAAMEEFLHAQMEGGAVLNAVLSATSAQAEELLRYRELIPETLSTHYYPHKNDLAVPIDAIAPFLRELSELMKREYPSYEVVSFGHIGDGNMHVNILKPSDLDAAVFKEHCSKADHQVFSLVQKYRGSISAEHGIGWLKKPYLGYSRSDEEIRLMREIKKVFDPAGILNPGKIFDL